MECFGSDEVSILRHDNYYKRHDVQRLQSPNDEKGAVWQAISSHGRSASLLGTLEHLCKTPGLVSCLSETLFGQDE